jgi:hypothetical protein
MGGRVFIHLGFGRCSTTTLQTNVFYKLAEKKNINYIYGKSLLSKKIELSQEYLKDENYKIYRDKISEIKKENDNDILLSDEDLIASGDLWCPSTWKMKVLKNLEYFGLDAKIIITIRKPSEWLLSVFSRFSGGASIEDFFLNKKSFKNSNQEKKFLISDFNYNEIIEEYKNKFKGVYVIKYEELNQLNFIKQIFNLTIDEIEELKKIYNKKIIRKGYTNFYSYKTNLLFGKLDPILKISKIINYEKIINFLDKFYPSKKLKIDFDKISVNIDKLNEEYTDIKSV